MTDTLRSRSSDGANPRRRKTDLVADSVAEDSSAETTPVAPLVEIAIPVYNEEEALEASIRRLRAYLDDAFPFTAGIVIVDNASTDSTWAIATRLCEEIPGVTAIHLDQKGRGRAIRTAWTASTSEIVAYMDVDLSTDLDGLLPLVGSLLSGHSQVAIGSRIAPGARVLRGGKREFISRTYNLILRGALHCKFSDAQCGFKAMRRDAVDQLLPLVEDQAWFFDTELLVQAEWSGLRIHEVSVDWIDDPDSRVHIVSTAREDLKGVWRLSRRRLEDDTRTERPSTKNAAVFANYGEMARYTGVGIASTIAYLAIFFLLRNGVGIFAANLVAALTTSFATTAAHILFTFGAEREGQLRRTFTIAAVSFAAGIGLTTATLAFDYLIGSTSVTAEAIAILVGMLAAAIVRFVLLREWAFREYARSSQSATSRPQPSTAADDQSQAA